MPGLSRDDILMLLLFAVAVILIFQGGKRMIFHQRGRLLIFLGVIAALGAIYFGEHEKLPESVQQRISDAGASVRQWTGEKLLGRGGAGEQGDGFLSGAAEEVMGRVHGAESFFSLFDGGGTGTEG